VSTSGPHYLVITAGTHGDMHPFMHVAKSLQALGRNVTFVTHHIHEKLIRDSGLPFVCFGTDEEYLSVLSNPKIWHPQHCFSALLANYGEQLKQINQAIRSVSAQAPVVAITHPFVVPAAAIAREQGLIQSIVAGYLAPSNIKSCHDPLMVGPTAVPSWVPMSWRRMFWRFVEKGWIDPVPVSQINGVRAALGLPKIHSFLSHILEAPDLSLALFPSWFAPPAPDWPSPLLVADFPLFEAAQDGGWTNELSDFLAAGDKPVVFTAGTGNLHAADFFACALAAVNELGQRAIFLAKDRALAPAVLPNTVLWQPYVPLPALLPRAAALVHHGGIGTTAEALRAGTPQLVVPFGWDQFDNGARVKSLGAGRVLPARTLRPKPLVQSLRTVTSSGTMRARCAQLSAHFVPPLDSVALCLEIERLVMSVCVKTEVKRDM
jgi:rhamnosyltransferase subunit B